MVKHGVSAFFVAIVFALPEAAARTSHVPVGQVVKESFYGHCGDHCIVGFQAAIHAVNNLIETGDDPDIQNAPLLACPPAHLLTCRRPFIQAGVGDEEVVDVPQGQQELPANFIGAVVAEEKVAFRFVVAIHPAHHVYAHFVGGFVELNGVAPAFVHCPAIFGKEGGVAEIVFERRRAVQYGCHHQHAVEPVAELAGEGFTGEVGGIPLFPVVRVGAIFQRAEGNDAGVKPGVAHILNTSHG